MKIYKATFNITLTQDEIRDKFGYIVADDEWEAFCKAFRDYFNVEHDETLSWLCMEWEKELKAQYLPKK